MSRFRFLWKTASRGVLVAAAGLALTLAACGGDDDDFGVDLPDEGDVPTAPADDGDDDGDGDTPGGGVLDTVTVDEAFWHSGFMVEVGDAAFVATEPDIFGEQDFSVTVEVNFNNDGEDLRDFPASVNLVTPEGAISSVFGSDVPNVPPGLSATGEFVFRVEEDFSFDDAFLLVGDNDDQTARVPLGPGGGDLVALEPSTPEVTGVISLELIDFTITSADLRYDVPVNYEQVETGKMGLTLNFDATSRRPGNWSVFAQDFALQTPGGSSVAPDGVNLPGLPGSEDGLVTTDLYLRFLVDEPPAGAYTLRFLADRWTGEDGVTEGSLEFELQ